ncbi:hypothetical protein EPK84_08270 (plasmid) [Sinorhizobium fredii]|nr:hypothetical protein EPK84_08270 [Sinorhizobium fredii]
MLNPSQTSRLLHGFRFEAPWESLRVGNGARWYNTVFHLENFGIHDSKLWRLQQLVAKEIRLLHQQHGAADRASRRTVMD